MRTPSVESRGWSRLRVCGSVLSMPKLLWNPRCPKNWAAGAFVAFSPNLAGRVAERFTAHLAFLARWRADWSPSEMSFPDYDPEDPPGIELAAEFDLLYRLSHPEVITDEDLEHFCTLNATANAWPYWREIAQAMTTYGR